MFDNIGKDTIKNLGFVLSALGLAINAISSVVTDKQLDLKIEDKIKDILNQKHKSV